MGTVFVQAFILSTYFDYNDYKSPIKTYVGDMDFFGLMNGYTRTFQVKVQQNMATTADDLIYNQYSTTEYFYSVENKISNMFKPYESGDLLVFYFTLDRFSNNYERTVFSFIDMLGILGGLFGLMIMLGSFFVTYFSDKIFYNTILSSLYQIEGKEEPQDTYVHSKEMKSPFGVNLKRTVELTVSHHDDKDFANNSAISLVQQFDPISEFGKH